MKRICKLLSVLLAFVLLFCACHTDPAATGTTETTVEKTSARTEPTQRDTAALTTDDTTEPVTSGSEEPVPIDLGGYAVSSSTKEATAAGMKILNQGGNAVDAAVAVALALGVTEPYSSGLGGSGVMVVYDPVKDSGHSLDYYACAGSAAKSDDCVGVPGFLAGMQEALDRWGTMSLREVIEPAIDLAENGFPATALFARRLTYSAKLQQNKAFANVQEGDKVVQTELAETLKLIRDQGSAVFYTGQIAQDIADACELDLMDLAAYKVNYYSALRSRFNGVRIYSTTAPTSGVVTSEMLTAADLMDVPDPREDPDGYLKVMKLATQIGYNTRRTKLVDPRFYDFDGKQLVSRKYVKKLVKKAQEDSSLMIEPDPERRCTTQFAVIDRQGMIVCVTNTLSDNWGGYIYVDGFYLNNTLGNFNQTGKNAYEPYKRPRTHFSPVLCIGDDGYRLAIGSPGGDAIPKVVSQVLIDVLKFDVDLQSAVDTARYYFDDDGLLCLETVDEGNTSRIDLSQINCRYYYSSSHVSFGCTAIVGYDPEEGIIAVSDLRRDGSDSQIATVGN